jgi:hypothetical protein
MLNSISWSSFVWMLIPIIIFYYLYVLGVYFRKDFSSLLVSNKRPGNDYEFHATIADRDANHQPAIISSNVETNDRSTSVVHEFIEDLKLLFANASKINMIKEELVQAIRSSLKKYPGIGETGLLEEINWHITQEAKETCRLELLPEDLKLIWSA